jgi:hypothetical protein
MHYEALGAKPRDSLHKKPPSSTASKCRDMIREQKGATRAVSPFQHR